MDLKERLWSFRKGLRPYGENILLFKIRNFSKFSYLGAFVAFLNPDQNCEYSAVCFHKQRMFITFIFVEDSCQETYALQI